MEGFSTFLEGINVVLWKSQCEFMSLGDAEVVRRSIGAKSEDKISRRHGVPQRSTASKVFFKWCLSRMEERVQKVMAGQCAEREAPESGNRKSELDKSSVDVRSCSSEEEVGAQPTARRKKVSKIKVQVQNELNKDMRVDVSL